jgi:hypothetical protein
MPNYTEEELKAFRLKDKRMSISGILQAMIRSGVTTNENTLKYNVELAKRYSDEVYEAAEGIFDRDSPAVNESVASPPTPTPDQKKVLDAVYGGLKDGPVLSWDEMSRTVLRYSTEVAGCSSAVYPSNVASAAKIVDWIKEN